MNAGERKGDKKKFIVPLIALGDWLSDTLSVIRGGSIGIRAPASITVFIKPHRTVKGTRTARIADVSRVRRKLLISELVFLPWTLEKNLRAPNWASATR